MATWKLNPVVIKHHVKCSPVSLTIRFFIDNFDITIGERKLRNSCDYLFRLLAITNWTSNKHDGKYSIPFKLQLIESEFHFRKNGPKILAVNHLDNHRR
jgi:hypothetical protein